LAGRGDLTAYRIVHGAADGAPGLAVDRYGDTAIVHAEQPRLLARWLPRLRDGLGLPTGYTKLHPRQASRLSAAERQASAPDTPAWGSPRERVIVAEGGARYEIRPAAGLSVGLFVDMREVRAWLQTVAAGRRILNLFAYTCGFGVVAGRGGAARVLNIDLSRAALAWGQTNYTLNGLLPDPHDFVYGDALDWLGRFARRGERFDLVVLDPPSFSTTRAGAFSVAADYPRLAALATRVVAPGGILLAATNHAGTAGDRFDGWLQAAATDAGRRGRLAWRWHEPEPDFPIAPLAPGPPGPPGHGPYLKVRALELT